MKTTILSILLLGMISVSDLSAQENPSGENFGNTLNLGLGVGYYGYIGHSIPVVHLNYEFGVANYFTLAPFVSVFSYRNNYYWGNPHYPPRTYSYRETVIPVGLKGSYYFDKIFSAGSKWDFYLAASLGFAIRKTTWESGYYGDVNVHHRSSGLYLDAHIGSEYHFNSKLGMYLDLSSGISTVGLAFHL